MKFIDHIINALAITLVMVSCAHDMDEQAYRPAEEVEATFAIDMESTRTMLGDDGKTTHWAPGDKLALWAKDSGGNYVAEGVPFLLRHFSTSYTKAFFAGNMAQQDEAETYTYYMCSPIPKSKEGTRVIYTLSGEQSGEYEARHDIMVARAVTTGAVTSPYQVELNTSFIHQMHALKIVVPEDRNVFGHEFNKLEIIFPQNVVGDITFDVTDPDAEPTYSNMSNTITVYNENGLKVGDEIWVFVLPGTTSGDIQYRVRSSDRRSRYNSNQLNKTLLRGHVTPIRMATPEIAPYTALHFSIGSNNLGEEPTNVTICDHNGNELGSFVCTAENRYSLIYDIENIDLSPYQNKEFIIKYESESAIVQGTVNVGHLEQYKEHTITPMVVPYLFAEDFSTFPSVSSNDAYKTSSTGSMGAVELKSGSGWYGARVGVQAGTSVRIAARRETSADYPARVDGPALTAIKPGKSVNIKITYDTGSSQQAGGLGPVRLGQTILQGYVTNTGGIASGGSVSSISSLITGGQDLTKVQGNYSAADYITVSADENRGTYTTLPTSRSYSLMGINNTARLSWALVGNNKNGANNNTFWLYIDNIKVQILK